MNVLVTGAAGFIGSHIVKRLLQRGDCYVVVIDDLSGGFRDNLPNESSNFHFVQMSICEYEGINELFDSYKFDYVYHLAAYAAEGLSHFIRRFNYNNNLIGSINLINASIKYNVKCFIFTSSIAVYGKDHCPFTEEQVPYPEDPYGVAKLAVENDLLVASKMFDLNYVVFRPHNVYGPMQNIGDKYRNVIGIFMNQIKKKEHLTVFGNGEQVRAFSYIDDVAPYIVQAAFDDRCYGHTFNIGGDTYCTINKLIKTLSEILNVKPIIEYLPERNEVKKAWASHDKAKRYFGIKETTPLEVGLKKMADWAVICPARQTQKFKNIEIEKNLPRSWR